MSSIEVETFSTEPAPPSQSGEDAINIINEYMTTECSLSNKLTAAIALALLDLADAVRNS